MEEQSVIHVKELLPSNRRIWFTLEEFISLPKDITTSQIEAIKLNEQFMYGKGRRYVVGNKSQIASKTRLIVTDKCTLFVNRSSFFGKNTSIIGKNSRAVSNNNSMLGSNSGIFSKNNGVVTNNSSILVKNSGMVGRNRTIFSSNRGICLIHTGSFKINSAIYIEFLVLFLK